MSAPSAYDQARVEAIANTLPPNARLLVQVGADGGALARHYHGMYPSTSWVVLEADGAAAQRATRYAERVIQVRLDSADPGLFHHLQWADAWLFDLTLERLQQPAAVLAALRAVIQYDACVLACVANPGDQLAALTQLLHEAGFRLCANYALNAGAASEPEHYLIKAMPAG